MNRWWRMRKHTHDRKGGWHSWHVARDTNDTLCNTKHSRTATFGWEEEWRDLDDRPVKGKVCPRCERIWRSDVTRGIIKPVGLPGLEQDNG